MTHTSSDISIVTAFFDIGRGGLSDDKPAYLKRSNDTYFKYFEHLATLDNELVVFTSKEFKERILRIRQDKPTTVVIFDFKKKLTTIRNTITSIQKDPRFIKQINPEEQKNIEYWSADYVLLTNLKTYFVNKAISDKLVHNEQVAWVDFGYVRDKKTLAGLKKWHYHFNDQINLFSIRPAVVIKDFDEVKSVIFNNQVYIIGGVLVAKQSVWRVFLPLLYRCQKQLIQHSIIDDDQGVYIMCFYKDPSLFCVNPLGYKKWFYVFRRYHISKNESVVKRITRLFGY